MSSPTLGNQGLNMSGGGPGGGPSGTPLWYLAQPVNANATANEMSLVMVDLATAAGDVAISFPAAPTNAESYFGVCVSGVSTPGRIVTVLEGTALRAMLTAREEAVWFAWDPVATQWNCVALAGPQAIVGELLQLTEAPMVPPVQISQGFAALRALPWKFTWLSHYDNTTIPGAFGAVFFTFANNNLAGLYFSLAGAVEISDDTNVVVLSVPVTFSAGQYLTFAVDPVGNTLTLAGFTTGDGVYPIAGAFATWFPPGQDLLIGNDYAAVDPVGGTYGNIYLATAVQE